MEQFGGEICGFSGSFETKPTWFTEQMKKISHKLQAIEAFEMGKPIKSECSQDVDSNACSPEGGLDKGALLMSAEKAEKVAREMRGGSQKKRSSSAPRKVRALTPAQELRFKRRYGMTALQADTITRKKQDGQVGEDDALSTRSSRSGSRSVSEPRQRPRSAASNGGRSNAPMNVNNIGNRHYVNASELEQDGTDSLSIEGVKSPMINQPNISARGGGPIGTMERETFVGEDHPEETTDEDENVDDYITNIEERREYIPHTKSTATAVRTGIGVSTLDNSSPLVRRRPASAGQHRQTKGGDSRTNISNPMFAATVGGVFGIGKFTDEDLVNELRIRQRENTRQVQEETNKRRRSRPRSAPMRRGGGGENTGRDRPGTRFAAGPFVYSQGPHPRSTMATKLSRAKAMAAAYSANTQRMHSEKYRNRRGADAKPRQYHAASMESDCKSLFNIFA